LDCDVRQCALQCNRRSARHWHALVWTSLTQASRTVWKLITSRADDLPWLRPTFPYHHLQSQWSRTTRAPRVLRQSRQFHPPAGRQTKVRPIWPDWRPAAARNCRTQHCQSARNSTSMLQARPCPRPIWIASTLMIRILRQPRSQALPLLFLRAASVAGRLLISSRTCDTFSTAPALHLTFAKRPSFPTDQSHSHSRLPRAVNPRGCSPLRTLSLAARVSRSRRTLARKGHAAAQRPRRRTVRKALACGLASYEQDTLSTNTEKPKEGLTKKEEKAIYLSYLHPHILHNLSTRLCIFSINPSNPPTCVRFPSSGTTQGGVSYTCSFAAI